MTLFEDDDDFVWSDEQVTIDVTNEELAWIRNAEKRYRGAQEFIRGKVRNAGTHSDSDS
jgi:hypothetical protein